MDNSTTKSAFAEYHSMINVNIFLDQIRTIQSDRYTKKLFSLPFMRLMLYAQLQHLNSLGDISLHLQTVESLQQEIGLDSISASQLSRKLRNSDPVPFYDVYKDLVKQVLREYGFAKGNRELQQLALIDASTISLCLTKYRWADFRSTKAGIKLHTRVMVVDENLTPDELIIKPAKHADKTEMNAIIVQSPDELNVFDRGYVHYPTFDQLTQANVCFVTRLKENAIITVLEEREVDPNGSILRDATVLLGNPKTYQMEHPLRLIETMDQNGNKVIIITNDFSLSVEELSDVYRLRWQIELFFKWIKQHLYVKRFYGTVIQQ